MAALANGRVELTTLDCIDLEDCVSAPATAATSGLRAQPSSHPSAAISETGQSVQL